MKIKSNKIRLLPFGVLIGVFGFVWLVLPRGRIFANTVKRIEATNPEVVINKYGVSAWGHSADMSISMRIDNSQDINSGDYIEIEATNHTLDAFVGRGLYKDNIKIATFNKISESRNFNGSLLNMNNVNNPEVQSYRQEDLTITQRYRIIFNENIENLKDVSLSISTKGAYIVPIVMSNRRYETKYSISVNGVEVNSGIRSVLGVSAPNQHYAAHDISGEGYDNGSASFWLNSGYAQRNDSAIKLENGDYLTFEITDQNRGMMISGVKKGDIRVFGSGNSYLGDNINANGIVLSTDRKIEVQVEEVSDYKVRYKVIKAPVGAYSGKVIDFGFKVLDIDGNLTADGNNVKPVPHKMGIYRADGSVKMEREASVGGRFRRAQGSVVGVLRGGVIVRLRDENGDVIAGYEKDVIIVENKTVGSSFEYQPPVIDGYDFVEKVSGEVKQGLSVIVVKYKKKLQTPAPELPQPKQKETQVVESPNTGLANPQTLLLPLFGILTAGTYLSIRNK